ncbi:DHA2 family efflux MFS transporter permease subunit [Amycolatopsis sp. OK19-0408]|uniref:DHA2 family efflux MFS transporter permease subunit n=1 Tax=Amycolatopsis iheyensis TaxID=2945988 RepID=A0A9X2NIE2_9PSEU|nr:DHA2 family efflux MFS transporter permease subunit [Amycolatopsis iheyensis]MCR6488428.1 DHA2 family efflux MFS transporter permease subunit [Amycolatopsis iheyensis]
MTGASEPLSPALRRMIVVVVVGSFMTLLDSTVVNVALRRLSTDLGSPLTTVEWLVTAYLLAMAAVLPVTGWAAARFGARTVYVGAIALFTLTSLACGFAGSAGVLIALRAAQGLAGGLSMPVGQMILAREAGPARMGRVLSLTSASSILAPTLGPTIGGLLLAHGGWPWIFFVNVPIGVLAVVLALRLLPADGTTAVPAPDLPGLVAITLGSVALTYGLANLGIAGGGGPWVVAVVLLVAVVLFAGFVVRARGAAHPVADLRLFRDARYRAAATSNFFVGVSIFGAVILMPLYFQIVRHEDTVTTGLLLLPQGAGVAAALLLSGRLIERIGSGSTLLAAAVLTVAATIPFVLLRDDTPYWFLQLVMVLRGVGIGACSVPAIAASYRAIAPSKIGDATVQLNMGQRFGGSAGTALFTLVLQAGLTGAMTPAGQAAAFATTFWWVLGAAVCTAIPAAVLRRAERRVTVGT